MSFKPMKIILTLGMMLPLTAFSNDDQCAAVFSDHKNFADFMESLHVTNSAEMSYLQTLKEVESISEELAAGRATPGWDDFDLIDQLKMKLESNYLLLESEPTVPKGKESLLAKLNQFSQESSRWNKISGKKFDPLTGKKYSPTEYGMRIAFQKKIQELNKYLPEKARFPFVKLPKDVVKKDLNKKAKELILMATQLHDHFMQEAGFSSHEQFVEKLRSSTDIVKDALALLENEQFEFVMIRPENGRFWIPKVGFQNQHVTGSSRGYHGVLGRNAVESSYLAMDIETYSVLDNDLKQLMNGGMRIKQKSIRQELKESLLHDKIRWKWKLG